MFFYMKYSYIILKEYEKRFWVKESHFLGVVVVLRIENSGVIIFCTIVKILFCVRS